MAEINQTERDRLLHMLRTEAGFLEVGGYGRTFRGQWRPTLLLRDSPVCANYNDTRRQSPCSECPLFYLVAPDMHDSLIPCHHIPLNEGGVTIDKLYREGSQESLDRLYRNWLQHIMRKLKKPS